MERPSLDLFFGYRADLPVESLLASELFFLITEYSMEGRFRTMGWWKVLIAGGIFYFFGGDGGGGGLENRGGLRGSRIF